MAKTTKDGNIRIKIKVALEAIRGVKPWCNWLWSTTYTQARYPLEKVTS